MAPPRRSARARAKSSSPLASLLFAIGCLVVLGVSFALGVAAGRRWPNGVSGASASPDATTAASRANERNWRAEGQGLAKTIAEAPPELTFYRELTAPLTSPPTPAHPGTKPEAKPKQSQAKAKAETIKSAPSEGIEGRFTVQVGAFKARSQADAVRTRLASIGQQAHVSEVEVDGATQYRVRVGSFATRDAAREAAMRLANVHQLATYVTTR